jgi:hypothetical protein
MTLKVFKLTIKHYLCLAIKTITRIVSVIDKPAQPIGH